MSLHAGLAWATAGLVLLGAALDLSGAILRSRPLRRWAGIALITSGMFAAGAFATGSGAVRGLGEAIHLGSVGERADLHAFVGSVGAMALVGLAVLRFAWRNRTEGPHAFTTLGAALLAAGIVSAVALTGTSVR